ncbi:MAG: bifunctional 2-C-methyl-D-erythritol 4-phosphate cytidylyltransferase/2-C-methyl-D-erythritol 2,4-cyclodiphosphate synthase [Terricaulis sp.]
MTFAAIIVAGGKGERAGGRAPKQMRLLRGRPVIQWSVAAMAEAGASEIVVAASEETLSLLHEILTPWPVRLVRGGETRSASVRAALAGVTAEHVLVHDAARPGLKPDMVARLVEIVRAGAPGVAPALPVADMLYKTDAAGRIAGEVEREGLMQVQTPQAFKTSALKLAYAEAGPDRNFPDDISVIRTSGADAVLIPGDRALTKITYREDFHLLERLLGGVTCVGSGFDAHRLGAGDHVMLCGVRIPHDRGLQGHSDADAGWHALVDAILGALGEGDIGAHFPPSDPQWKGASSDIFLRHAASLAEKAGARIMHADVTLICERPKITPHRDAMRARTAEILNVPISHVGIKATTTERMGFTGREEGIAAQAIATLDRLS